MSLNPKIDRIGRPGARNRVTLRSATPADLELLRDWDRAPHILASKGDDDWQWETALAENPPWREQLIAEIGGHPIGFIQIIDPERDETQYWGCVDSGHRALDIWIGEVDSIGHGHGTEMMKQAIARCFADPKVHTILIDPLESNIDAHRFYERLGFKHVVNRCFGDDRCKVYRLKRPGIRLLPN